MSLRVSKPQTVGIGDEPVNLLIAPSGVASAILPAKLTDTYELNLNFFTFPLT
jgi:hypothetical protein